MSDDLPIGYAGERNYHEGDALLIPFELVEEFTDEYEPWEEPDDPVPIDLTNSEAEFYAKETRIDRDADALLEKTSTGEGADDEDVDGDIVILDPAEDGRLRVHIRTGDTDGWLDAEEKVDGGWKEETRLEERTVRWVLRVIDEDGNRVSSEMGSWEIAAS